MLERRIAERTVPTHRLFRKTTLCPAPLESEADFESDKSSKVGCVRYLLESLRCNTVNKLLGVRCCTVWNVAVADNLISHALDLPPLACQLTRQNRNTPRYVDWEIDVFFQQGPGVLITLMEALASNRTVEVLRLQAPKCTNSLLSELIHSLRTNNSLRHLTLTFASPMPLLWPRPTRRWREVKEEMSKAVLRSGGLQTLFLRHTFLKAADCPLTGGYELHSERAQRARRCAIAMATHLSQVCRLDTCAGTRAGFKSSKFRLWLLSYFLTTTANRKLRDTNLHSRSLRAVHVKHVCWEEIRTNVRNSSRLDQALHANRCVAAVAKQLSQVCCLETFSGPRQGFKSATFRWWLLSHFLPKGMLPKLWQSRILCGSAQAYADLPVPDPPIRYWSNRDYMNLDSETCSDSSSHSICVCVSMCGCV